MEKKELLNLKKKISELSNEEQNLRDIYLSELSKGNLQGPSVGYSSIDKPWLKYYDLSKEDKQNNKTVFQCLYDNNINHCDELAIEYFGSKIKFSKLFDKITQTSKALAVNGVSKGDFVTICAPGIPETVYSFYALSKLGAVANMIANYFEKQDFIDRIKECNSKILIVMDAFYDDIKDAVLNSDIEKIVVVPTFNSSPLSFLQQNYKVDKKKNEILWNDFLKEGKILEEVQVIDYEPNLPLTMVYSSGTTGSSKGILLSNDSFQNSINSYFKSGLDISRGQKFYQIIPTWFSTGISTSIHLPLSCGASIFMDPRFERKIFTKNIIKAKPNYTIAPTSMYEGLLDNKLLKNKDLSFLYNAFEGGEPLTKELAEKINNEVFLKHGNNSSIKVGYGQCECGATITTQTEKTEHCNGSVGIPLPGLNIQICNNLMEELQFGKRGQIVVQTPNSMLEYYQNEIATSEYFYIDENGIKWNCTGDIGYLDENGNLFVEGRASDYTIINGEKIYNFDIENIIKKISGIKLCDVLPFENNKMAVHIIFDENIEKSEYINIIHLVQQSILNETKNINIVPEIFKIRNEFPHAKSGKRDIKSMQEEKDGFFVVSKDYNIMQNGFIKKI